MFIDDTPNLISIVESIFPYLSSGGIGAIILAIYSKWASKKKDNSDINKTDAETEQIQTITIKNLTQELSAITDKLVRQVDMNSTIKKELSNNSDLSIFKLRTKEEELINSAQKTLEILVKIKELEFLCENNIKSARRLMEKLNIPYWESDGNGSSTYISQAWLNMFDVTYDTISDWINIVVEEDKQILINEWKSKLIDQDASNHIAFRIRNKDGSILAVKSFYSIVRDRSGNVNKVIGVTLPA